VLIFLIFAILNLAAGYAIAVLLGQGPQPWYAIILPGSSDEVVQIEVEQPQANVAEADSEESVEVEEASAQPNPAEETNEEEPEPEDVPLGSANEEPAEEGPNEGNVETFLAGAAENLETAQAESADELEETEPVAEQAEEPEESKEAPTVSNDDIESMFAAAEEVDPTADPTATPEPSAEDEQPEKDTPLDQDEIASLFNG